MASIHGCFSFVIISFFNFGEPPHHGSINKLMSIIIKSCFLCVGFVLVLSDVERDSTLHKSAILMLFLSFTCGGEPHMFDV